MTTCIYISFNSHHKPNAHKPQSRRVLIVIIINSTHFARLVFGCFTLRLRWWRCIWVGTIVMVKEEDLVATMKEPVTKDGGVDDGGGCCRDKINWIVKLFPCIIHRIGGVPIPPMSCERTLYYCFLLTYFFAPHVVINVKIFQYI